MESLKAVPGTIDLEGEDVLNDETFVDAEEWQWDGADEEEEDTSDPRASKDSISRLMSSTIVSGGPHHSSNIMRQLPGPNMSSIVTCSDLESGLSSMRIQEEDPAIKSCAKLPPLKDNSSLRLSAEEEESSQINLDDFDFSDPSDSPASSKVKSIYFDNVWAPPDTSILKPPNTSSNPWNSSSVPKSDSNNFSPAKGDFSRTYKSVPTSNVMTLEEIEAGMLNESTTSTKEQIPIPISHPIPTSIPPPPLMAKAKTLEEIERELLQGTPPKESWKEPSIPSGNATTAQGPVTATVPSHPHIGQYTILQRHPLPTPGMPMHPMMVMRPVHVGMRPMFAAVAAHQLPRGIVPIVRPLPSGGYMIPPSLYPMHLQQHNQGAFIRHPFHPHQLPPHPYLEQQMNLQRFHGLPLQQNPRFARRERNEEIDEYAGLMSKKEQDWLIHIQKMQLDNIVADPYVDDYYNLCYNSKKLTNKSNLLILKNVSRNDNGIDSTITTTKTSYIPFNTEGSLGKIQVSNVNRPRRLLDLKCLKESDSQTESESGIPALAKKELTQLRKLLLDIERLYLILMKIDYEDKRMAALPESSRGPHLVARKTLCGQLLDGITENNGKKMNYKIATIRKGAALILRTILVLDDLRGKKFLARSLIEDVVDFPAVLIHKEYETLLIDSIEEMKKFDTNMAEILRSEIEALASKSVAK